MADVFISYCRSEATSNLVRRIAGELHAMGISCWYDTQGLNVGEIGDFIKAEIEQSKVFLLLLDKGANESSYVFSEVCASFPLYGKQITPIPVQIEPFAINNGLWFRLSGYNILSCASPESVPVDELTRKIAALLHKTPQTSAPPQVIREPNPPQTPGRIIESGKYGNNIAYVLDEHGLLTIYGNGNMGLLHERVTMLLVIGAIMLETLLFALFGVLVFFFTWKMLQSPWNPQKISRVVIESGVTSIGERAFFGCGNLTSVSIPDSVTRIEDAAFSSCDKLTGVSVPKNAVIARTAFDKHTAVTRRG